MKKKMLCTCVAAAIIFVTAIGFATGAVQKVIDDAQMKIAVWHDEPGAKERLENHERKEQIEKRKKADSWAELSKFDQMREAMDATIENPIDYNNILFNYEYLHQAYHFEQEQLDYIADLIIKGYDAGDIIDLCYFWMDTNEDISIIEEMYLQKGVYVSENWMEHAFNKVTAYKCGVLTEEDIDEYLNKGLSVSDIALANKLCRRGSMTIQEILAKRLEGSSFAELSAQVYQENVEELPQEIRQQSRNRKNGAEKHRNEPDIIDNQAIMAAREMAKMNKKQVGEYYQKAVEGTSVVELLQQTKTDRNEAVKKSLREKNLNKPVSDQQWKDYARKEERYEHK